MSETPPNASFWSKIKPSHWVALILIVAAILFVAQNRITTSIELFWLSVQAPLWLVLTLMFGIGWLSGYLATRRRSHAKQLAKEQRKK